MGRHRKEDQCRVNGGQQKRNSDQLSYCVINFLRREPLATGVAQHGHRERVLTSAMINLLRIVAIELGTWRSVLGGGASGSITFGNGKFFEPSGVTRS